MSLPYYHGVVFAVAYGTHVSLTPPDDAPKEKELGWFTIRRLTNVSTFAYKYLCAVHALAEIALTTSALLIEEFGQADFAVDTNAAIRKFTLMGPSGNDEISFPPLRLAGAALIILGAIARWMCFQEMGRYFSPDVSLQKDHKLVTAGPYAWARHPAYAALLFQLIGSVLWHGTEGAWFREVQVYKVGVWGIALPCFAILLFSSVSNAALRQKEEDKMLKKKFGKEWSQWSKAVPSRLIPGIY